MHIRDTFTVAARLQDVWDFLFDVERMGQCVPGVEHIEEVDETHYKGVIQIQVGPIRARFTGTVELVELEPPHQLVALVRAQDRNTASLIEARFQAELAEHDGCSTQVTYDLDLTVRGRLGQFGSAVIQETATRLTQQFVSCLQQQLRQDDAGGHATQNTKDEAGHHESGPPSGSLLAIMAQAFLAVMRRRLARLFGGS